MSAGPSLKAEVLLRLQAVEEIAGLFDGPPARASYPYVAIDTGTELDWSSKSHVGREVGLALTIWDDEPSRLERLSERVETALSEVQGTVGWQLVSLRFQRKRLVRDVAGPWALAIDYRARMLKN